jgi:hypothetical protein
MTTSSTAITVTLLASSNEFVDSSHGCTPAPSTSDEDDRHHHGGDCHRREQQELYAGERGREHTHQMKDGDLRKRSP